MLFLAGLGRSGTTLLERLLGELPGVCPLGEVVHLWQRGVLADERCGCGAAFHVCPFWREVGERAFGGWDQLDIDRVLALKARVDRTRFVPELAAPRLRRSMASPVVEYTGAYRRLYHAVRDITGCQAIVDSSKHASLAYCLRWCDDIDLRVLHVVRDSRGVAHSWTKRVLRPEGWGEDTYMPRWSPARTALRWDSHNAAVGMLGRTGVSTRRATYEDLTIAPQSTLLDIAGFVGLDVDGGTLGFAGEDNARPTAHLTAHHTVSGNPMRFRTGQVALRRDDAWRSAMAARHRVAVTALTWPLLVWYGYAGGGGRDAGANFHKTAPDEAAQE